MTWFDLVKATLLRKVAPTWNVVHGEEYDRVHAEIQRKLKARLLHLQIIRHGPDQYSAYYERVFGANQPISMDPEWWETVSVPTDEAGGGRPVAGRGLGE